MKVAVIGTGISGNVAAHHLAKEHEVTVFEAGNYVGGHTHTHDIVWEGQHYAIDTGFIVFNERTYPHFIDLLKNLQVKSRQTEMSFSVRHELSGLEYNGHSLDTLFAQRRNLFRPAFHRMVSDILRFNREAPAALRRGEAEMSLGDFLDQGRYGREFVEHYIIPMGSAIWSCDAQTMAGFPAHFFIRFFDHHGLLQIKDRPKWFVINGGSREYIKPLVSNFKDQIQLNCPVQQIRRFPDHVEITTERFGTETFDAVFIATHSDQALQILETPTKAESEVLGAIHYQRNETVLHTDPQLLPKKRKAWAAWNYHINPAASDRVAVTYNMNILQGLKAPVQFCVTLNDSSAIKDELVLDRMTYEHPVFTAQSIQAQTRHREINGTLRTYYCGAYWRNGFHEDGVVSALDSLAHFEDDQYAQPNLRRTG
ncbi:MAG: NAD(P)/FAD-dependent oxidoreductase [Thiotrichales bacterium]